jgi:hypothetical protein
MCVARSDDSRNTIFTPALLNAFTTLDVPLHMIGNLALFLVSVALLLLLLLLLHAVIWHTAHFCSSLHKIGL